MAYKAGAPIFVKTKDLNSDLYSERFWIPTKYFSNISLTDPTAKKDSHGKFIYAADGKPVSYVHDSKEKPVDNIGLPYFENYGKKEKGKFRNACAKAVGTAALLASLFFNTGCNPEPPEPPQPTYVKIISLGDAVETLSNSPMTGNVRFIGSAYDLGVNNKPYSKNFDVEMPFGEQAYLGMMPEGQSAYYEMDFMANDALKRIFKQVAMKGTNAYQTDVLKLSGFDWYHFWHPWDGWSAPIPQGNIFKRLNEPSLTISFNPDRQGTGRRLPQAWIDECVRVWNKIRDNSNGVIQNITYVFDGNKTALDRTSKGDVYIFYDSQNSGVSNFNETNIDGSVSSIYLYFNSDRAPPAAAESEILDSLYVGEQGPVTDEIGYKQVRFTFKRPAGDKHGYRIYEDHEEQNGFTGSTNYLGQTRVTLTQDVNNILPDPTNIFGRREIKYDKREITERLPSNRSPDTKRKF